jgi:putative transcriptional regulator
MKSTVFAELKSSIREAGAVRRGEKAPSRVWKLTKLPDGSVKRAQVDAKAYQKDQKAKWDARTEVAAARSALSMSQSQFAGFLGISVRTLHHWEQGSRQPTGAARVLVQVAQKEPKALKRALALA